MLTMVLVAFHAGGGIILRVSHTRKKGKGGAKNCKSNSLETKNRKAQCMYFLLLCNTPSLKCGLVWKNLQTPSTRFGRSKANRSLLRGEGGEG